MKYDWFVDGHDDQCRGLFVHWYHHNQIEPITLGDPLFDGFKRLRKPDPCISANYIEPNRFLSVPWIWEMLEIDISSHNTSWVTSLNFLWSYSWPFYDHLRRFSVNYGSIRFNIFTPGHDVDQDPWKSPWRPYPKFPKISDFYPDGFGKFLSGSRIWPSIWTISIRIADMAFIRLSKR